MAVPGIKDSLKKRGVRLTRQRQILLDLIDQSGAHLDAESLYLLAHEKDPKLNRVTVYRTLKLLADCGLASEVAFHDGIARYEHQYNRRGHHHMVCTECGASVEFFSAEVGELEREIGRKHHFVTTRHTFQIYGVCEDCRRKGHGQSSERRVV